jgi:hypothetical protein
MRKRNVLIASGAVVAIVGLTASIAVASIPDSRDGQIYGCRSLKNGALRVVDAQAGQQCSQTEQAVNWSGDTRKTFLVQNGAYEGPRELSATPTTLMSVLPPAIEEGTYLLTATIHSYSSDASTDNGATIVCRARGAAGSYGYSGAYDVSDSLVVGGGDSELHLQTVAMTTRDFDTDELVPITVSCTGNPAPDHRALIGEYHIALIPIPSR